ncbi:hypothetical protein E1H12_12100 [Geitlerinema sp. P-1104]|uniref:hypothetical protein n=1 Tax=Geitlerinema sp. P-1104 TaxID=2546230 RepID=UPI001476BBB1|nr:hypothetical protein [Geitlerinema sp. P-1104]NMG59234.1 hypothetical protein [Geitlerinema sp. P-1104]
MERIKVNAHVGQDGVLSLPLPVKNQDVEVMVMYPLVQKRSHQNSKQRFEAMLAQHQGQTLSDSTELLREDRRRG